MKFELMLTLFVITLILVADLLIVVSNPVLN